jgi:hypothetical protein
MVVVALIGVGVVAGVALADGGKGQSAPAPAPSASGVAGSTGEAFSALITCATEQGLDGIVADAFDGSLSLDQAARALTALGACEDEARALVAAISDDVADPGDLVRGIVGDTAACLDGKGVTLSRLADALLGDEAGSRSLQDAAQACLPDLSSLTR